MTLCDRRVNRFAKDRRISSWSVLHHGGALGFRVIVSEDRAPPYLHPRTVRLTGETPNMIFGSPL